MGKVIAITAVILALFAAGCIIYIAREITSRETLPNGPDETDGEERD
jgi:hypothetical protein